MVKNVQMLEVLQRMICDNDLEWCANGEDLRVVDVQRFYETVLGEKTGCSSEKSFRRNMNNYGFYKVTAPEYKKKPGHSDVWWSKGFQKSGVNTDICYPKRDQRPFVSQDEATRLFGLGPFRSKRKCKPQANKRSSAHVVPDGAGSEHIESKKKSAKLSYIHSSQLLSNYQPTGNSCMGQQQQQQQQQRNSLVTGPMNNGYLNHSPPMQQWCSPHSAQQQQQQQRYNPQPAQQQQHWYSLQLQQQQQLYSPHLAQNQQQQYSPQLFEPRQQLSDQPNNSPVKQQQSLFMQTLPTQGEPLQLWLPHEEQKLHAPLQYMQQPQSGLDTMECTQPGGVTESDDFDLDFCFLNGYSETPEAALYSETQRTRSTSFDLQQLDFAVQTTSGQDPTYPLFPTDEANVDHTDQPKSSGPEEAANTLPINLIPEEYKDVDPVEVQSLIARMDARWNDWTCFLEEDLLCVTDMGAIRKLKAEFTKKADFRCQAFKEYLEKLQEYFD